MDKRKLGRTPLEVSRLGLGCVTFGREVDEQTSFAIVDHAIEKGINFFDTAEGYGGGEARLCRQRQLGLDDVREKTGEMHSSEKILGRWLRARGCRNEVVLQTKIGTNFSRTHLREALDASLERLQTDSVDCYLLHHFEATPPLEETLQALTEAQAAGLICVAGCSNFTAEQLCQALAISRRDSLIRFEVVQPIYNLVSREIEADLVPLCHQEQIAVTPFSPLGAGFLTGKYSPGPGGIPGGSRFDVIPGHMDIYFSERNFALVEKLRALSQTTGHPMARLALAWVLRNTELTSVLIGATSTTHIDNAVETLGYEFRDEWLSTLGLSHEDPLNGE